MNAHVDPTSVSGRPEWRPVLAEIEAERMARRARMEARGRAEQIAPRKVEPAEKAEPKWSPPPVIVVARPVAHVVSIVREDADAHVRCFRRMPAAYPPVALIVAATARASQVSVDDILSERRIKGLVEPRQAAAFLARELTPLSLLEIGKRMGGRDHTTVLHSCTKVRARKDHQPWARLIAAARADILANVRNPS